MIYHRISDLIGHTPLFDVSPNDPDCGRVLTKLEFFNPGGSIKDRPALAMIQAAESTGRLRPGMTLVEATAGNTGIGLAMVAKDRGFSCVLFVPNKVCIEKYRVMVALGAQVIRVSDKVGMAGAVEEAQAFCAEGPTTRFLVSQFNNPANPEQAALRLGPEIEAELDRPPDGLAIGGGTGGTFSGLARWLKAINPRAVCHLVQPLGSVFDGAPYQPYDIEGIGNSFIPPILERDLADQVVTVTSEMAYQGCARLARDKALLVGSSSGANDYAARLLAHSLGPGSTILTVFPDHMTRYLSRAWTEQLASNESVPVLTSVHSRTKGPTHAASH